MNALGSADSIREANRKPMTSYLARLHSDESPAPEIGIEVQEHTLHNFSDLGAAQPLQSQPNHGRPTRAGNSQNCMEVSVQGDHDRIQLQREREYLVVGGTVHPNLAHVHAFMPEIA